MKANLSIKNPAWGNWIIVPLRLFMGVTFIYAGLQKLTDPQYFNPAARGYIGHQIAAFASGSPLHSFLTGVAVPHATLFGALVAYGELAIGLGVLLGLLSRVASLFGLLINLVFFLSADWHIFPYFYGADIVFLFCWLTLLIAGPANQILPALDTWLVKGLVEGAERQKQPGRATVCAWIFGVQVDTEALLQTSPVQTGQQSRGVQKAQSSSRYHTWQLEQLRQESRRNFVLGSLSGGTVMLILALVAQALHLLPGSNTDANSSTNGFGTDGNQQIPSTLGSPVANETPTSVSADGVIAQISSVPVNSSTTFTLASNGDPGILVHLSNDQFVAFDATCTHAGCPVDYDPSSQQLVCPCHGASFDPSKAAAVTNGPAQTPLVSVPIKVNQSAGTISLGS